MGTKFNCQSDSYPNYFFLKKTTSSITTDDKQTTIAMMIPFVCWFTKFISFFFENSHTGTLLIPLEEIPSPSLSHPVDTIR